MLNRRYLRIKVFQALYSYWQDDSGSAARIEKELINSIERTYDLFLALMQTFGELRHVTELRIEERGKKHLPTQEDLRPNRRFIDNPVMKVVADSERLRSECDKRRVSWVGQRDLFVQMLRDLEADEAFKAYMTDPEPSFRKDQVFMVHVFSEHVANSEALLDVFENRSIHWLEDLDLAASLVKRVLEQVHEGEELPLGELDREPREEYDFATRLFRRTIELGAEHEQAIAAKSRNWESDRIALSDMILMKMALTEVRTFDQIPVKVTLNEYIEIAKAYSTPKSKNFINGVLDKLFIEMKGDGRIHKVGRGLLES